MPGTKHPCALWDYLPGARRFMPLPAMVAARIPDPIAACQRTGAKVRGVAGPRSAGDPLHARHPLMNRHPLPLASRADLFAHLAAMEQAGLPPDKAFGLLRLPGGAAQRIDAARMLIARGTAIGDAGRRSGLFTDIESRCVHAATQAGSPFAIYRRLAARYAERVRLAAAFKARMLMPLLVLTIALVLRPLPALVTGTIGIAHYVAQAVFPLLVLAGLVWFATSLPYLTGQMAPAVRQRLDATLLRLPLVGGPIERANLCNFVEHLAILLEAGVPMFDALPLAQATMGNTALRADHAHVLARIRRGATLAEALSEATYLGRDGLLDAVTAGEHGGRLPEALFRHAAIETAALSLAYEQFAAWLPRLLYALLLGWIAYGVLASKAFMPGAGRIL